jgi:hypothetical protein
LIQINVFEHVSAYLLGNNQPNSSVTEGALLLQEQCELFCSFFSKSRFLAPRERRHTHAADFPTRVHILASSWFRRMNAGGQSAHPLTYPSLTRRRILLQGQFVRFCPFLVDSRHSLATICGRLKRNTDSARPTAAKPSRCDDPRQCVQLRFQRHCELFLLAKSGLKLLQMLAN